MIYATPINALIVIFIWLPLSLSWYWMNQVLRINYCVLYLKYSTFSLANVRQITGMHFVVCDCYNNIKDECQRFVYINLSIHRSGQRVFVHEHDRRRRRTGLKTGQDDGRTSRCMSAENSVRNRHETTAPDDSARGEPNGIDWVSIIITKIYKCV